MMPIIEIWEQQMDIQLAFQTMAGAKLLQKDETMQDIIDEVNEQIKQHRSQRDPRIADVPSTTSKCIYNELEPVSHFCAQS